MISQCYLALNCISAELIAVFNHSQLFAPSLVCLMFTSPIFGLAAFLKLSLH